jgi:hypothetical protein
MLQLRKLSKKLSVLSSIVLLTCIVTFSACKKDDAQLTGKDMADDICACYNKTNEAAIKKCIDALDKKYARYIDDTKFQQEAVVNLLSCTKMWEWERKK